MTEGDPGILSGYVRLKGDASARAYFRGHGHILVQYPGDAGESFDNYLLWTERYRSAGIPVPEILDADRNSLQMRVADWGDVDGVRWFRQLSGKRERISFVRSVYRYIPLIRSLAADLSETSGINLVRELDFFLTNAGETIFSGQDIAWLKVLCERLVGVLQAGEWGLAHRDYHFRNILVKNGRICIIDFQDTRFAPSFYDNVSLLFDNYLDISGIGPEIEPELNMPSLRWVALQRNLKALGTFAWFGYRQGKRWFRDSIPLAMAHVLSHLEILGLKTEAVRWRKLMTNWGD